MKWRHSNNDMDKLTRFRKQSGTPVTYLSCENFHGGKEYCDRDIEVELYFHTNSKVSLLQYSVGARQMMFLSEHGWQYISGAWYCHGCISKEFTGSKDADEQPPLQ